MEAHHRNVLSNCEFCAADRSERHEFLIGVNKFMALFSKSDSNKAPNKRALGVVLSV